MKKIIIGFSKPKNKIFPIYSWLIRAIYITKYSHVYLRFYSDTLERDIIYESVGNGVRYVGLKHWKEHAEIVEEFTLVLSDEQYLDIMKFCVDNAGIDYGVLQAVGIFIAKLLALKENPFKNDNDKMVCSEMIGRILKELGYEVSKSFDLLSPKDINLILKKGCCQSCSCRQ